MTWLDHLLDLVCRLLKVLDGDCADLQDGSAENVIDQIDQRYDPDNPPQPADNQQQAEWCTLCTDTTAHLDLPENSLPPASDATLRGVVTSLQSDLGC